ncbi:MAG: mechanosensitive ion channel family protein [Actinomycetota bacterium]
MWFATVSDAWGVADWERLGAQGGGAILVAILVTVVGGRYAGRARHRAAAHMDEGTGRAYRRTSTVTSLVVGTAQVLVWFAALLIIIGVIGVEVGPLIASAGIAGVALGFGAQTLVKDTLAGLFIALEGQFDVGDSVDLQTDGGPVSGTIEGLTLRVTIVRQYDGALSIVPNGSIHVTSNKTRGWGRALVDVRVALDEDPERVRGVLNELFDELVSEPPFDGWLRDRPKVLGVIQLTDVAQVIRVAAETQPNHRLDAERGLRSRIATRIVERGVKAPPVMPSTPRPTDLG